MRSIAWRERAGSILPNQISLLLPQQRRPGREVKQRHLRRQGIVQNRSDDTRRQRRMGIGKEEMSSHGFRAVARTILDEVLGVRPD
ncbi:MAG: hypothetical protein WCY71_12465 [Halothiobacillaceae bacterium]